MTIAIGALTPHSFVFAADSQEGTGVAGDLKTEAYKIAFHPYVKNIAELSDDVGPEWETMCVTGAGDSAYLDILKGRVVDRFNEKRTIYSGNLALFRPDLEEIIEDFYAKHIIPFNTTSGIDYNNLRVELIVGIQNSSQSKLWYNRLNVVEECKNGAYVAVGSGSRWATHALRVPFIFASESQAAVLAAYGVFAAIKNADGCGGKTAIISLRKGNPVGADPECLRKLESLFDLYLNLEYQVRGFSIGRPQPLVVPDIQTITKSLIDIKTSIEGLELFPEPVL